MIFYEIPPQYFLFFKPQTLDYRVDNQAFVGCLIAWACRLAFIKGYYGFVSLIPKTRLIEHYKNAYGFEQFGRQLAVDAEQSHSLIKKYLKNE
jgi:hypothetical protein